MPFSSININVRRSIALACLLVVFPAVAVIGDSAAQPAIKVLSPVIFSKFDDLVYDEVTDVDVDGRLAYVTRGGTGLAIVDVGDPANCVKAGGYVNDFPLGDMTYGVAVSGSFAYTVSWLAGLQVFDVSVPSNCRRVGAYGSNMVAVALAGNVACVAGWDAGLQVFDVSNPTNCSLVKTVPLGDTAWDVAMSGKYAYVAAGSAGMQIVDVSNPAASFRAGGYSPGTGGLYRVAVSGNLAFVAVGETRTTKSQIQVVDVSTPTNCFRVGSYEVHGTGGIAVSGNSVFFSEGFGAGGSLAVIDISDPTNYVRVGRYPVYWPGRVTLSASRIFMASGGSLLVIPTMGNIQTTLRVDAQPGKAFTIEGNSNVGDGSPWITLLTTNVPTMPFDFVDFDVKTTNGAQKFYRVRQ